MFFFSNFAPIFPGPARENQIFKIWGQYLSLKGYPVTIYHINRYLITIYHRNRYWYRYPVQHTCSYWKRLLPILLGSNTASQIFENPIFPCRTRENRTKICENSNWKKYIWKISQKKICDQFWNPLVMLNMMAQFAGWFSALCDFCFLFCPSVQ